MRWADADGVSIILIFAQATTSANTSFPSALRVSEWKEAKMMILHNKKGQDVRANRPCISGPDEKDYFSTIKLPALNGV